MLGFSKLAGSCCNPIRFIVFFLIGFISAFDIGIRSRSEAAVYSPHFFMDGQTNLGQPFTSAGYYELSDAGHAIGFVRLSGVRYHSIYSPDAGHTTLKEEAYNGYWGYSVNNSGSVVWTEYDDNFSPSVMLYENGSLNQVNFGTGNYEVADINNLGQLFGFTVSNWADYGQPEFSYDNFVWQGNQFNYFDRPDDIYFLMPLANNSSISDDGLGAFVGYDENWNWLGVYLHRLGTTTFSKVETAGGGGVYTEGDFLTTVTPSGKVYSILTDKDENYMTTRTRFVTYDDQGKIQRTIDLPLGGSARMNDKGDIVRLDDTTGQFLSWNGSQWIPLGDLNLPTNALAVSFWDYNSQGRILGDVYGLPEAPDSVISFYATPVPEPGSALVLGGLILGLGARFHRSKRC